MRSGHKFLTPCDELVLHVFIVIYCFLPLVLFVVQQSFLLTQDVSFPAESFYAQLPFTGSVDVLSRFEQVEQSPSRAIPRLGDTSDTSRDESNIGEPRRPLCPKKRYKMKKVWGLLMLGSFL